MYNEEVPLEKLLSEVGKAHSNKINKILGKINVHKGQPMLLFLLSKKDGIPQSTLSKELNVTPSTVSTMVKRMEKAGFVIRKRDSEDERVSNVYITDYGKVIINQLKKSQEEMENIIFGEFSNKEKKALRSSLEIILKKLSE